MSNDTIAIIDANIRSGQDEIAREDVMERLQNYEGPCVTPLWVNWLRARADLRIVCSVSDLPRLDDFLIDVVRNAQGVTGTRAVLSFGGFAHIANLMDIPLAAAGNRGLSAATVRIELVPGHGLPRDPNTQNRSRNPHVKPVWLLRTYHSYDADLNMLLLSDDEAAITGYIMSWVRPVKGVADTSISTVKDWRMLATPEQMIEVAEQFFHLNGTDGK